VALVRVGSFRDPYEAYIARSLLESAGIPALVLNEFHIGVNWLYSNALGGVSVEVSEEHAEDALLLLKQPVPEGSKEAESEAEVCPGCGASSGRPSRFDARLRAGSMIVGVPLTIGRYRSRCSSCGHGWRSVPAYRGLLHTLLDAAALALLAVRWVLLFPWRLIKSQIDFGSECECWSCGAPYGEGDQHCPSCRIDLPDVEAYRKFVEPGRQYDGACPECHTPFSWGDYRPEVLQKLCSRCRSTLPG
jgi:hypothetical protein